VMTIGGTGPDFLGCLAHNETLGLGLVSVGQNVALLANSPKFPFDKGADVKGTWAVDGGAATPFTVKTDTAHTVAIDIPHDPAHVTSLVSGRTVTVKANGTEVAFQLGPMMQAFTDVSTCMETKKAP
jgi:hypothetical protein